ncbi:2Fe-2S iron-sulfur cluster-binding protein [Thermodesulfobacteriota bacterium]
MINLTIDGKSIQVPEGTTVLEAARELGIKIPTLCYIKDTLPITSCMLCVVRVEGRKNLVPACATGVEEGMAVINDDPDVTSARCTALELLLSDHAGDCMGPCQVACPAGMDIPEMLRQMAAGRYDRAIEIIREHIALPAVTGYICPAPCEKACRRGQVDEPLSIRLIKRCAAELDLAENSPYKPSVSPDLNKKTAIIGAGPAGLAAAYYLIREGILCTVFDGREEPGGMLRYGVSEQELPRSVLDDEIEQIRRLGVLFKQQVHVGRDISLEDLLKDFDAVFLGTGKPSPGDLEMLGFDKDQDKLKVNQNTFETDIPGVFAGGDVRKGLKLAVRSLADGKKAAASILQFLKDDAVTATSRPFNTRMGKIEPEEMAQFKDSAKDRDKNQTIDSNGTPDIEQASSEAQYCLHCDCRKPASCRLRIFAGEYGANARRYRGKRRAFVLRDEHPDLVYEPGKCINCGICVRITEQQKENLGLTFIGRGFDVKVSVPFDKSIKEGLTKTAGEVVKSCPTGALAFK